MSAVRGYDFVDESYIEYMKISLVGSVTDLGWLIYVPACALY